MPSQPTILLKRLSAEPKPVVLMLHCSAASGRAWRPVTAALGHGFEVLAPDLIGYGPGETWPRGGRLEPESERDRLWPYFETSDRKVHLVGHSYGGMVALGAARWLPHRIASLTLVEPVAFPLIRAANRPDGWLEIAALAAGHMRLVDQGHDADAGKLFVDYWSGVGTWAAMDDLARARTARHMPKVAAEWRFIVESQPLPGSLNLPDVPVLLVQGGQTRKPAVDVLDALDAVIPAARRVTIDDAGHLSPHTHPARIAALVAEHVRAAETMLVAGTERKACA